MKAFLLILVLVLTTISQEVIPEGKLETPTKQQPYLIGALGVRRCRLPFKLKSPEPFPFAISLHQEVGRLILDVRTMSDQLVYDNSDEPLFTSRFWVLLDAVSTTGDHGHFEQMVEFKLPQLNAKNIVPVVFQRSFNLDPRDYVITVMVRDSMIGDCERWITRLTIAP